jgi:hypothetical protein
MGMTFGHMAQLGREVQAAGERGVVASSAPYYSRLKFRAEGVEVTGVFTYTFTKGTELLAFGYAKTDNVQGTDEGIGTAQKATKADTNLSNKGSTLAGQKVLIQGLSVITQGETDYEAARLLLPEVSVTLSLNGDEQSITLGTPINIPGIGGLYGLGATGILEPALADAHTYARLGANGMPFSDNFRRVPEGYIWMPQGGKDGNMVIKFKIERDVVIVATERAAATGILPFDPPAIIEVDLMAHLICMAISNQSVNV